jgi:hypothetical protein
MVGQFCPSLSRHTEILAFFICLWPRVAAKAKLFDGTLEIDLGKSHLTTPILVL